VAEGLCSAAAAQFAAKFRGLGLAGSSPLPSPSVTSSPSSSHSHSAAALKSNKTAANSLAFAKHHHFPHTHSSIPSIHSFTSSSAFPLDRSLAQLPTNGCCCRPRRRRHRPFFNKVLLLLLILPPMMILILLLIVFSISCCIQYLFIV
jgi:hypothetical protein